MPTLKNDGHVQVPSIHLSLLAGSLTVHVENNRSIYRSNEDFCFDEERSETEEFCCDEEGTATEDFCYDEEGSVTEDF